MIAGNFSQVARRPAGYLCNMPETQCFSVVIYHATKITAFPGRLRANSRRAVLLLYGHI